MLAPQMRFLSLLDTLVTTGAVLAIALIIRKQNATDEPNRLHGQFIPYWIAGFVFAAGVLKAWGGLAGPYASLILTCFALLIGWAVGFTHGFFRRLAYRWRQPVQEKFDDSITQPPPGPQREASDNPYQPPPA